MDSTIMKWIPKATSFAVSEWGHMIPSEEVEVAVSVAITDTLGWCDGTPADFERKIWHVLKLRIIDAIRAYRGTTKGGSRRKMWEALAGSVRVEGREVGQYIVPHDRYEEMCRDLAICEAIELLPTREREAVEWGMSGRPMRLYGDSVGLSEVSACRLRRNGIENLRKQLKGWM